MLGVVPANGSQAITRARDKLRCHQILAREKIGMPVTGFAHSTRANPVWAAATPSSTDVTSVVLVSR